MVAKGRSGDVWQLLTAVGAPAFSSFCSLDLFLPSLSSNLLLILRLRNVQPAELAEEEVRPETHTVLQKWWQGKRSGASMTCSYISKGVELWVSLCFGFRVREFSGWKGPQGISSPTTYSKQDQLWIQTKLLSARDTLAESWKHPRVETPSSLSSEFLFIIIKTFLYILSELPLVWFMVTISCSYLSKEHLFSP